MLKKTITYVDYDGVERTEEHYFNLTESELTKKEMSESGGYAKKLEKMIQAKDAKSFMEVITDVIRMAYGQKSPDGRRFIKNDDIFEEFEQTEAYNKLFMELVSDDEAASDFIVGILPRDIATRVKKAMEESKGDITTLPEIIQSV